MSAQSPEKIFELVGRIIAAWNEVDLVWYLVFTRVIYSTPRALADAIYSNSNSSHTRRELIMAAVAAMIAEHSVLRERIRDLKRKTEKLARKRNDIAHGLFNPASYDDGVSWTVSIGNGYERKPNKLAGLVLSVELPRVLTEIEQLIADLDDLRVRLMFENMPPEMRPQVLPKSMPRELRESLKAQYPELAIAERLAREGREHK